ncbi:hypothetical protein QTP86_011615 [Hemibagrus guttatus]|nr:hypothetical protein QTP86_011615 [Hemibagrus guttatus]
MDGCVCVSYLGNTWHQDALWEEGKLQDNAPCHKAEMVQEWFDDHNNQFEVLTPPPTSPDLNPIQHLWDMLYKQVPSMEAPPHNLQDLKDLICSQQCTYPDAVHIIAGDFNHADLKAVLPKFYQHVKCATRGANTLDKVYSNIKLGYRVRPLPHLGQSDHMSLLLITAYAPLRKTAPTITEKSVKIWPEGASQQLQDCFDRTNWDIFEHPDLEVFTDCAVLH